jgi:phosphoenolpyruvate mutase
MKKNKIAYVALSADLLHHGHMNVISKAAELGDVVIGLLTDKAIAKYKRLPHLDYKKRELIVANIKGVINVIPQKSMNHKDNLKKIRPDYVVHGDDWKIGIQSKDRAEVIQTLKEWDGKLIEVPYTHGVDSSSLNQSVKRIGTTPNIRLSQLRRLLAAKEIISINEVHNGLSGLITETACIKTDQYLAEFDGMWSSSLTDSTAKGMPDIEAVDISSRLSTVNQIFEVTTKPMIFDGDTGGKIEIFNFTVKSLERTGISAVVIEDKVGLKKNSLLGNEVPQSQDSIKNFQEKISSGKRSQITNDFMVIARVESLILEKGMNDAIKRAHAYAEAGADAIMIHSREKEPDEIFEFCKLFQESDKQTPIMVVPSSFNTVHIDEWKEKGVRIVCHANHMLRSAYPAMLKTAMSILKHGRSKEAADENCMPIKEILELIPGTK